MGDKSAYQEKIEAQLDQWKAKLDMFGAKAMEKKADVKIEYDKQLWELEKRRQAFTSQFA